MEKTSTRRLSLLLGSIGLLLVLVILPFITACSSTTTAAPSTITQTATTTAISTTTTTAISTTTSISTTTTQAKIYKIGITQIITHPALDAARNGFKDYLASQGYVEGKNVIYDYESPQGDMSANTTIANKFVADKDDLIYAISTPSVQACATATKNTGIPVVFAAVTDPVAAGVVASWDKPGGNVTGASDMADVAKQVGLGMSIKPFKTLGVIYNAGETNSVVQINDLKAAQQSLGIDKIVEATAATTNDVYTAAQSLVGRVDAIWVPSDNTVASAIASVIKVCEDNKIPLYGSDVNMAEEGMISGEGLDYTVNGETAGKIAVSILQGADPATIPVATTPMTIIYLDPAAAQRMGVTIPSDVLKTATQVGPPTSTTTS